MEAPVISIIMPAYNAQEYIGHAIESILSQTFSLWELIVINDASSDSTAKTVIESSKNDPRIKLVNLIQNSGGSPFIVRKQGIRNIHPKTEYICPIDADDWIESDYLEKMITRLKQDDADIAYSVRYDQNKSGITRELPERNSIFRHTEKNFSGRELFKETLSGWKINCNGGLYRKILFISAQNKVNPETSPSIADEIHERHILTSAYSKKVIFVEAAYMYRDNDESITRKPGVRNFETINSYLPIMEMAKENFGRNSQEYRIASQMLVFGILDSIRKLNHNPFLSTQDRLKITDSIKKNIRAIDQASIKGIRLSSLIMILKLPYPLVPLTINMADSTKSGLRQLLNIFQKTRRI